MKSAIRNPESALLRRRLAAWADGLAARPLFAWVELGRSAVEAFVRRAAASVPAGARVLDAGAGACPYKRHFRHVCYESTDEQESLDSAGKPLHAFLCRLDHIPRPDCTYDAILCTQVLEHVPDPQAVIKEFHRVLAPGGKLFLTAPQGWGVHEAPHHYFNFTCYGLELLFRNAGFQVDAIRPMGGMLRYLGCRLQWLPHYIYFQHLPAASGPGVGSRAVAWLKALIGLPFYLLSLPLLGFLVPVLSLALDWLDRRKDYTLGYACACTKPGSGGDPGAQ